MAEGSVWRDFWSLMALFALAQLVEDRTLHEKLPGYAEYAAQVRYRLVPGVW